MRTHRFGRRIKLPSTIALEHQIRTLMARDEIAKAEADAKAAASHGGRHGEEELLVK